MHGPQPLPRGPGETLATFCPWTSPEVAGCPALHLITSHPPGWGRQVGVVHYLSPPILFLFPSGRTVCGVPRVDPIGRTDSKSAQVSRAGWRRLSKGPGEGANIPRLQGGEAGGEGRGEEGVSGRMGRIPGFSGRFYPCAKAS